MHPAAMPGDVPAEGTVPPWPSPPQWQVTHFPPTAPSPVQPQGFPSGCGQLAPPAQHTSHRGALMFGLR